MRPCKFLLPLLLMSLLFSTALMFSDDSAQAANSTLYYGAQGSEVNLLQNSLNSHGCICAVDGLFGPETLSAVKIFQRAAGLTEDGVVGPRTWEALGVNQNKRQAAEVSRGHQRSAKTITMVATGYCPCNKCNYPYGGKPTYMGDPVQHGIAAVDPHMIGMGSQLLVEGYGYAKASDQGNAIKGNRIDLCFNSHSEALKWGVRTVKVNILN